MSTTRAPDRRVRARAGGQSRARGEPLLLAASAVRTRAAAAALAALVGALAATGALAAVHPDGPVLWIFRHSVLGVFRLSYGDARGLSLPGVTGGLLLLAAAALAWAVAGRRRRPSRGALLGVAGSLALLGFDEALAIHDVLLEPTGSGPRAAWATASALGAAAVGAGVATLRARPARLLLAAGGSVWLAAQALEAAVDADAGSPLLLAREAAELASCAVLLLALLVEAQRVAAKTPGLDGRALGPALVAAFDPLRVAVALGAVVVALAALGAATHAGRVPFGVRAFQMEGERSVPAFYSAGLLLLAALLAVCLARAAGRDRPLRGAAVVLAAVFATLAADELLAVHEPYERELRSTGSPAQVALLVCLAGAGIAWLVVLGRLRGRPGALAAWLAAPALWLAASGVDQRGLPSRKRYESVVEDALEMAGSSLFVLALLVGVAAHVEGPGTRVAG